VWEWFVANRIWIFIVSIAGFILAYFLRYHAARAMARVMPTKRWRERMRIAEPLVAWIMFGVAGTLLGIALAAVIASYYNVSLRPTLSVAGNWLLEHAIPIMIIAIPAYVSYRVIKAILPRMVGHFITIRGKGRQYKERVKKRSNTLGNVLTTTIGIIIATVAIFMVLSEIGINITPLLAGAGVAGLAIGFGAQSLIRDVLAGFFIIVEDQYDVGDVIKLNNNVAGGVEGLNLRRTMIRDLDGVLHMVPNGEIKMASNLTKKWSRAHLNISVAYKEDLDRVMAVLRKIWEEMAQDPDWEQHFISKTPWLLRVDDFGDSGITIKMVGETKPGRHWETMGELRLRIKRVFDKEGIEIPWPHVKLYMGDKDADKGSACPKCSQPNPPGSKFCSHCGAKLKTK